MLDSSTSLNEPFLAAYAMPSTAPFPYPRHGKSGKRGKLSLIIHCVNLITLRCNSIKDAPLSTLLLPIVPHPSVRSPQPLLHPDPFQHYHVPALSTSQWNWIVHDKLLIAAHKAPSVSIVADLVTLLGITHLDEHNNSILPAHHQMRVLVTVDPPNF